MSSEALSGEQLKDQAIKQALAGNDAEARRTANQIRDRDNLRQAWQMILAAASYREDVQAVKETIASCPDRSLLVGHSYRELPIDFVRRGHTAGGIEIAKAMGDFGVLPLMVISILLSERGDSVGMREALSAIQDEKVGTWMMGVIDELRRKRNCTTESSSTRA